MSEGSSATSPLRQLQHEADRAGAGAGQHSATHAAVELSPAQAELARLVVDQLRANCRLNLQVRRGLAVFGFAAGVVALTFAALKAGGLRDRATEAGVLLACLPVLVLVVLSAMAGMAAWAVHARELDETYGTLDAVSRMEREGEVAVSSRGLIHAFEEKLQNTRRAFGLLLWLGRTLFIVCLALAAAAIITATQDHKELLTGVLGGSSVVGALLGAATKVPRNISHHVADVIQIQTVVTGCDRQISLLETVAIDIVNRSDRGTAPDAVLAVQSRMDEVVANAVDRIERFADPEFPGIEPDAANRS